MLISVHVPKTAGISFRKALESYFGGLLICDYADLPLNQQVAKRAIGATHSAMKNSIIINQKIYKDAKCVHGHFLPLKYRWMSSSTQKKFIVWLRDPIERLASHYYYWMRNYNPEKSGKLRRRVVEEGWSLEKFCFSSQMQNTYTKLFWGFPFKRFDFIGVTENYDSDLNYFSRNILDAELENIKTNLNKEKKTEFYIEDSELRTELELFHQKDMQLYMQALAISNSRKS